MNEKPGVKKSGRLNHALHRMVRRSIGERVCTQHVDGLITCGRLRETKDGKLLLSPYPFCWHPAASDGTTSCIYIRRWVRKCGPQAHNPETPASDPANHLQQQLVDQGL